jgi:short-subunit dehydrogenase involved in D-alanine esterification of teichoic acids
MISQTPPDNQRSATLIVTGASSGIGSELARQLAERGNTVIAVGRDEGRLAALARQSPLIKPTTFDLARIEGIDGFAASLLADDATIDGLINNAAIQHDLRMDDARYTGEQIAEEIAINLTAPIVLTRALLPHLQARSRATIVNISSALSFVPKRTSAVYSATKAGLRLFSDALRVQLKTSNIEVIDAVMPLVDTPMTAGRGGAKMSAAMAAAAIVERLWQGPGQHYIGKTRAFRRIMQISPTLAARIMQRP